MLFNITNKAKLARLLAVAPHEIDHLSRRLERYYRRQKLPKPDGTFRTLLVPHGKLKLLQKKIKEHILDAFPWLPCVHGGIRGRSIIWNAQPHVGKAVVFSLDIKEFFPHVGPDRVFWIFRGLGFGEEPARILAKLTTWNHQLPQGAPTSTSLANLSLIGADCRIGRLAEIQGFSYTRYVDDLTVSGGWRLLKFRNLIQRIIESEGFLTKPQKTMTMHAGMRQVVTQLVVNAKVNVPRERRAYVRREVLEHLHGAKNESLGDSLSGRVYWLRYVNPAVGERLLERVDKGSC